MNKFSLSIYLLALGAFVTGTAELVVAGIIRQLADDLSVSVGSAGQLIAAYSLAFAVAAPVVISATAKVRRKSLLIGSMLMFAVGCALSTFASDFALAIAARAVIGASSGVFSVVAFGAAAKLVPPEQTGRAVSTLSVGVSVSTVIGVPLGVVLTEWWGWRSIFAALGLLILLVMLVMIRLLPHIEGDVRVPFKRQFAVLRNPVILSGLFLSVSFSSSFSLMNTYLVPFVEEILHMKASYVSLLLLLIGVCGLIGSKAGGIAVDRFGSPNVIGYGLALSTLSMIAAPAARDFTGIGIALLSVWTFAMSAVIPAILTYFIRQAPESSNLLLGLNTSVLHLGVAIGASVGGAIVNSAATVLYHPAVSGLIALLGLAAACVSFVLGKTRRAASV